MLGIRTRDRRMVGIDESTELWRPALKKTFLPRYWKSLSSSSSKVNVQHWLLIVKWAKYIDKKRGARTSDSIHCLPSRSKFHEKSLYIERGQKKVLFILGHLRPYYLFFVGPEGLFIIFVFLGTVSYQFPKNSRRLDLNPTDLWYLKWPVRQL